MIEQFVRCAKANITSLPKQSSSRDIRILTVAHVHAPENLIERNKHLAWEKLCLECGWACRLCGAIPKRGEQFENKLCEDCRLSIKNESNRQTDKNIALV
jgi:hypothetical protein